MVILTCLGLQGVISFHPICLYSQKSSPEINKNCYREGDLLFHRKEYDSAAVKFRCFLEYSPVNYMFSDPLKNITAVSSKDEELLLTAVFKLAVCYLFLTEYDSGSVYLDKGLQIFKQTGYQNEKLITGFIFQKANFLFLKEDYTGAARFYREALRRMHTGDPLRVSAYMNLGDICFLEQDNDEAVNHYRKALILLRELPGSDRKKSADLLANLGAAYFEKNDHNKAIFYFLKAKALNENIKPVDTLSLGRLCLNLGSVCLKNGETEKSIGFYGSAARLLKTVDAEHSPERVILYKDLALAYSRLNKEDSCFFYLSAAKEILSRRKQKNNAEMADLLRVMGDCSAAQNRWKEALDYYTKALSALIPGYIEGEENFSKVMNNPVRLLEYCRISGDRARVSYQLAVHDPGEKDLIMQSFYDCQTSLKLFNMISKRFGREGSKLVFNEPSRELYERVLNIVSRFPDMVSEPEKGKLFELSDNSRNNVLLETMNEKTAKAVSGIPDALLKKDSIILHELTRLSNKYFSEVPLVTKDIQKTTLQEIMQISDLSQEHDSLVREFEQANPRFFEMKYGDPHVSSFEIRQKLKPRETLLEYFTGDSALFIFLVSKDNVKVVKAGINREFSVNVKKYSKLLAGADFRNYFRISNMLYRILIAPVREDLVSCSKLIIIPDEVLSMVPFETLVSDTVSSADNLNHHYLVYDFEICYHYSASLWSKCSAVVPDSLQAKNKATNFIGYSPGFSLQNNSLPFADDEILQLAHLMKDHGIDAVAVLNERATEAHFKKNCSSRSWIHLATHSQIDIHDPERSGLLFSRDRGDLRQGHASGILYLGEIYNLKLQADLVVLSACATGTGKIIKSEGVMALTRGFLYAGASNIVYSLWNITDRHTRDFMIGFYTGVVSGMGYSAALRAEKLKMIANPATCLPTIWAPYVLLGR
jgi:CHAT domain-containing protein